VFGKTSVTLHSAATALHAPIWVFQYVTPPLFLKRCPFPASRLRRVHCSQTQKENPPLPPGPATAFPHLLFPKRPARAWTTLFYMIQDSPALNSWSPVLGPWCRTFLKAVVFLRGETCSWPDATLFPFLPPPAERLRWRVPSKYAPYAVPKPAWISCS